MISNEVLIAALESMPKVIAEAVQRSQETGSRVKASFSGNDYGSEGFYYCVEVEPGKEPEITTSGLPGDES